MIKKFMVAASAVMLFAAVPTLAIADESGTVTSETTVTTETTEETIQPIDGVNIETTVETTTTTETTEEVSE